MRFVFALRLALALWLLPGALAQAQNQSRPAAPEARCGPLLNQVFTCTRFSFTYKVPFGWVDRTEELEESDAAECAEPGPAEKAARGQGRTLLQVFERPPDAPGKTINSAVVIAEESLRSYPGLKTAADYFGPIADIAEEHGFTMLGSPYSFMVHQKRLVRGDFSQEQGSLKMFESSLVMIAKGAILSFTFIAGSEEEVEDLIAGLSFEPSREQTQPARPRR